MIFKLVVFAVVCYVLYRLFMNDSRRKAEKDNEKKKKMAASGEMVRDPVCGTYVDKDSSITVRNGSEVVHFCSYECRRKYLDGLEEQKKLAGND